MNKGKLKCIFRSDDGEWVCCEDSQGKPHFFRTIRGKHENYGRELRDGCILGDPLFDENWKKRDGQPLSKEEIAYRKGFRACFAEFERMKRGKRS